MTCKNCERLELQLDKALEELKILLGACQSAQKRRMRLDTVYITRAKHAVKNLTVRKRKIK